MARAPNDPRARSAPPSLPPFMPSQATGPVYGVLRSPSSTRAGPSGLLPGARHRGEVERPGERGIAPDLPYGLAELVALGDHADPQREILAVGVHRVELRGAGAAEALHALAAAVGGLGVVRGCPAHPEGRGIG